MTTIRQAADQFLGNIKKSQPHTTWKGYKSDLTGRAGFLPTIKASADVSALSEDMGVAFVQGLLDSGAASSTRRRKAACLREFLRFASAEYRLDLKVDRLNYAMKSRHLLTGSKGEIEFPSAKIERVLLYLLKLKPTSGDLALRRDIALVWTLAETGLRVSEACSLKIGDIDRRWRATFIGKGAKQATIRFGKNSRAMITAYLASRAALDKATGVPRSTLPLFCRHDLTSGRAMVKPINPKTAERIIHGVTRDALGSDYDPEITAHKFRHYFVTTILSKTGGDLKAAKDLARHANIATTDRYAHRDSEQNAEISQEVFG